jgi:hypothetical protein
MDSDSKKGIIAIAKEGSKHLKACRDALREEDMSSAMESLDSAMESARSAKAALQKASASSSTAATSGSK